MAEDLGTTFLPAKLSGEDAERAVVEFAMETLAQEAIHEATEQAAAAAAAAAAASSKPAKSKGAASTAQPEQEFAGTSFPSTADFMKSIADKTFLVSLQDDVLRLQRFKAVTNPEELA